LKLAYKGAAKTGGGAGGVAPSHDVEAAREAGRAIRELAKSMKLGRFDWEEWKQYRDFGRR
jgi:hypothetical protein